MQVKAMRGEKKTKTTKGNNDETWTPNPDENKGKYTKARTGKKTKENDKEEKRKDKGNRHISVLIQHIILSLAGPKDLADSHELQPLP